MAIGDLSRIPGTNQPPKITSTPVVASVQTPAPPPTQVAPTPPPAPAAPPPRVLPPPTMLSGESVQALETGLLRIGHQRLTENATRLEASAPSGLTLALRQKRREIGVTQTGTRTVDSAASAKAYDSAAQVIKADSALRTGTVDRAKPMQAVREVSLTGSLGPLASAQLKHYDKQFLGSSKEKAINGAREAGRAWAASVAPGAPESLSLAIKSPQEIRREVVMSMIAQKPEYQRRWSAVQAADPEADPITVLSAPKQQIAQNITDGILSAQLSNHVNQSEVRELVVATSDDGLHQLKKNFSVPESVNLNGREYRNVRMLGAGGNGAAFMMQSADGHKIVLKAFVNGNETAQEDSIAEIRAHVHAVAGGSHPNVVGFVGAIRHTDRVTGNEEVMIATEFAGGGDLNRAIKKIDESGLGAGEKMAMKHLLVRDMMQGMQQIATERNMTHYDLKPANFFLSGEGTLMVGDFGSSVATHANPDRWVGVTPSYVSPEGMNGTEKSDIYTLGVIVNEVILGKAPTSVNRTQDMQIDKDSYLEQLVGRMTSTRPEDRPTIEAVLNHPLFQDPTLDQPDLRQKLAALLA